MKGHLRGQLDVELAVPLSLGDAVKTSSHLLSGVRDRSLFLLSLRAGRRGQTSNVSALHVNLERGRVRDPSSDPLKTEANQGPVP